MSELPIIDTVSQTLASYGLGLVFHHNPPATKTVEGLCDPPKSVLLNPHLQDWLNRIFPNGFFRHQAIGIQQALERKNTVVATRTSSGKSLIYSIPVFESLLRDPHSTALFIYPQKALANDQLKKLQVAAAEIAPLHALAQQPHFISRYDGATPDDTRREIRKHAQVILTNPDMLHVGILQHHDRHWQRFFKNLRYVIIDECHEYRGIFGTNVAYVIRRLRQVCAMNGSSPTFIATSATIRDPQEHLQKLTGLPFLCVAPEKDGSIQGPKKFWIVSSNDHFYDLGRRIALDLAKQNLSVLAFCPSRIAAEEMMDRVLSSGTDRMPYVRVYRAGLTPREREDIETGLRNKSVRLVFSTNALELGIDIGTLDAVVCIGLPGSMMSLWQRAGRVGRSGKEGAIVLIPADTPIDSYYASHPVELLEKENEPLVLNLKNQRVVHCHYACALREVGDIADKLHFDLLGEEMREVKQLRDGGVLSGDIFYRSDPHMVVNIRSMGEGPYELQCKGEKIGEIDEYHLLREAYRNAIYRHGGKRYRVKDIVTGKRLVLLDEYRLWNNWNKTSAFVQKQVTLKKCRSIAEYNEVAVAIVEIDVTEYILNVVEKDGSGKIVNQWQGAAGTPSHRLPTEGTRLLIQKTAWDAFVNEVGPSDASSALESTERLLFSLFPTISGPCEIQDFSSFSETLNDGSASIYLYDMVYDGVDLTTAAFEKIGQLTTNALERLANCNCVGDGGCFRCIANPRKNQSTSKAATLRLLKTIQEIIEAETPKIISSLSKPTPVTCPTCRATVESVDRFCKNCGQKLV